MKKVVVVVFILVVIALVFYSKGHNNIDKLNAVTEHYVSDLINPKEKSLFENESTKAKPTKIKSTDALTSTNNLLTTAETYLLEAKEIRRCKSIPKTQEELELWLTNANAVGEPNEYIEDVLSRFELCSQSHFTFDTFVEPLIKAAKLGSDNAVAELWAVSEKEYFVSKGLLELNTEETIEHRIEFNKLKYQLSENLALRGGEQAILNLVKGYQYYEPESGKSNNLKALAYADFGLKITKNNELYLKLDFIKQRISKNMDSQQLQQAQMLTDNLLSNFDNK